MTCGGCGSDKAYRVSYSSAGESCNECRKLPGFTFSDVYYRGEYFDPNIAHDTLFPLGSRIRTREQKALLMKQLGISEAGDKYHGAR